MHDQLQFIGENIINKLKTYNYEYICDEKYSHDVRIELRFCFCSFEIWEEILGNGINSNENNKILNKHKKITDLTNLEFTDLKKNSASPYMVTTSSKMNLQIF